SRSASGGECVRCATSARMSYSSRKSSSAVLLASAFPAMGFDHSMAGQGLDDVHSVVRPTTLCSCCGAVQLDDLRLRKLASHEAHDVRTPALQRAPALIEIQRFVVDASDAALVSANMTKDHLDHVRRDAEAIMQGSRQASPEIMKSPIRYLPMARLGDAGIDVLLASAPVLESASEADTEDVIPRRPIGGVSLGQLLQDRQRRLRQRDDVLALVLGPGARQCDGGGIKVDLAPAQVRDLVAAGAGEDQKLDDGAVLPRIRQRLPDGAQLVVGKDSLAHLLLRLVGEGDRIGIDITLARRPGEIGGQCRPHPVTSCGAAALLELGQPPGNGAPGDALDRQPMQRLDVDGQVSLGLDEAARLLPLALALQEERQQRAEGLRRGSSGALFLAGRIAPEPDLGE